MPKVQLAIFSDVIAMPREAFPSGQPTQLQELWLLWLIEGAYRMHSAANYVPKVGTTPLLHLNAKSSTSNLCKHHCHAQGSLSQWSAHMSQRTLAAVAH